MAIDENTRLGLRQAFEDLIGTDLAAAAMEAMPNLDYSELATKTDVDNVRIELRGEMAELRGEFAELRAEFTGIRAEMTGEFTAVRGEMQAMEGRLMHQMAVGHRQVVFAHWGATLALATVMLAMFIGFG
ncbi:MAG: hypothetical protein ACR2PK_01525 [Acidimicrobiales bacterium]